MQVKDKRIKRIKGLNGSKRQADETMMIYKMLKSNQAATIMSLCDCIQCEPRTGCWSVGPFVGWLEKCNRPREVSIKNGF